MALYIGYGIWYRYLYYACLSLLFLSPFCCPITTKPLARLEFLAKYAKS